MSFIIIELGVTRKSSSIMVLKENHEEYYLVDIHPNWFQEDKWFKIKSGNYDLFKLILT